VCNFTRILCAAIAALALLQNSGCSDGAERRDGALRSDAGDSPNAANPARADAARGDDTIPVVRSGASSRKAEASSRSAVDSNPGKGASIPSNVEARDVREALRTGLDPRLATTLDPEASADRVDQIESLDAAGDDLGTLLGVLAGDPDPAVRVAAADLLAESERTEAIDGLLLALEDPSREVVLQALETLALVGERDIVPSIEPLLDHSDAEIREAAEETLYFVDDSDPDEPESNADSGTDSKPGNSPGSLWDR